MVEHVVQTPLRYHLLILFSARKHISQNAEQLLQVVEVITEVCMLLVSAWQENTDPSMPNHSWRQNVSALYLEMARLFKNPSMCFCFLFIYWDTGRFSWTHQDSTLPSLATSKALLLLLLAKCLKETCSTCPAAFRLPITEAASNVPKLINDWINLL